MSDFQTISQHEGPGEWWLELTGWQRVKEASVKMGIPLFSKQTLLPLLYGKYMRFFENAFKWEQHCMWYLKWVVFQSCSQGDSKCYYSFCGPSHINNLSGLPVICKVRKNYYPASSGQKWGIKWDGYGQYLVCEATKAMQILPKPSLLPEESDSFLFRSNF